MLFAVALNSARLGRRVTHPRHRCGTAYCRRSCALGAPQECAVQQLWGSFGLAGRGKPSMGSPAQPSRRLPSMLLPTSLASAPGLSSVQMRWVVVIAPIGEECSSLICQSISARLGQPVLLAWWPDVRR